jgi:ABC-type nitrate/sulfonate/bicarbonate transport system substrate-binding protein
MTPVRLARASGSAFGVDDISCAAATQLGLFAAEGLDVRWSDARGGVAASRAVLEGKADVAYAGFGPVIALRAEGHPCRIVVSQARALAQALVVRSSIQDVSRLKNKSWAVDGIGAMSHHMARLVVRALEIPESEIGWIAVGPPPERIKALLEGRVDASLIRTEEALALHRDHADKVHRLLDFDQLKQLVPLQPHGVLMTTESYERAHPDVLLGLAKAMILASRALHDDFGVFRTVAERCIAVKLAPEELHLLWQREHASGGWAVNGELTPGHWEAQLRLYGELVPQARAVTREELISARFVPEALAEIGIHPARFDQP